MGTLDVSDDACDDNTCTHLRDIQQLSLLQQLQYIIPGRSPYEPLMRDPWWIFSCFTLFQVINKSYSLKFVTLIGRSTRFVIMVGAILLAISFTIMDILSSVIRGLSGTDGYVPNC